MTDPILVSVRNFALLTAELFIILALIAAIAQTIVALYLQLNPPGSVRGSGDRMSATWLEALKGVLEALAALPGWVAIFLAGLALLWIAHG